VNLSVTYTENINHWNTMQVKRDETMQEAGFQIKINYK